MNETDRNLVDAHLCGDASAFEKIIRRHGPSVLGFLTKMTHNPDTAEDLFQDTFRKVHQKAASFRGESLKPWLFAIASNTALSSFRKKRLLPIFSLSTCPDGINCPAAAIADTRSADPEAEALAEERKQHVRRALLKLPEKQRAAVILSYYHKLSYQQIADALECTIGAVKTNMFRAMKKLAAELPDLSGGVS